MTREEKEAFESSLTKAIEQMVTMVSDRTVKEIVDRYVLQINNAPKEQEEPPAFKVYCLKDRFPNEGELIYMVTMVEHTSLPDLSPRTRTLKFNPGYMIRYLIITDEKTGRIEHRPIPKGEESLYRPGSSIFEAGRSVLLPNGSAMLIFKFNALDGTKQAVPVMSKYVLAVDLHALILDKFPPTQNDF